MYKLLSHRYCTRGSTVYPTVSINASTISLLSFPLLMKGGAFVMASAMLSNSFKRVKVMRMTRVQNCKSTCYFALGVIVLVFVAYLLMDKVISR